MTYKTISVEFNPPVCYLTFKNGETVNTITHALLQELTRVLDRCDQQHEIKILVLQGNTLSFCSGADFNEILKLKPNQALFYEMATLLYDLWLRLACSDYISIAHVEGAVKAGGTGFVAACDIAIAHDSVEFALSELLFGIFPACVLPFLQKRIGIQRAHYFTLSTKPITAELACHWGLVDATGNDSRLILRQHLMRLSKLDRPAISQYKQYHMALNNTLMAMKTTATRVNAEMFSQKEVFETISHFLKTSQDQQ